MERTAVPAQPPVLEPTATAVHLDEITVRFGGVAALSQVSFSAPEGAVVAIVGPNGAGKSTLLNVISGLVRPDPGGELRLGDTSALGWPASRVAGHGVGRSFQDPPLLEKETVLDNVLVGAHRTLGYGAVAQVFRPRRVREHERDARERARASIEFMGLSAHGGQRVGGLPYSVRKLVDIARAMASTPSVLLLDEPTSGLDAGEQERVRGLLLELRARAGLTVVLVEHHMDVVRSVADTVVGLQAGAVLAQGPPQTVLDSPKFREAVIGNETEE